MNCLRINLRVVAIALGLSAAANASTSALTQAPAAFEPAQTRFAKEQLTAINKLRLQEVTEHKVDPALDQLLDAATNYYGWISKYGPQIDQLTEVFNNAAYKIDSIILGNEPIAGMTYIPMGTTDEKPFTYADLRDYLKWSHEYAAKSPSFSVMQKNFSSPNINQWQLTFNRLQEIVASVSKQMNECAGDECIHVDLRVSQIEKRGVVIEAYFPIGAFADLVKQGLKIKKTANGNNSQIIQNATYDITSLIDEGKEFETTLTADIAKLNPSIGNIPTAEPDRWNYFACDQIDDVLGDYRLPATNESIFSLNELLEKSVTTRLIASAVDFQGHKIITNHIFKLTGTGNDLDDSKYRFRVEQDNDQLYVVYQNWNACGGALGESYRMSATVDSSGIRYHEICSDEDRVITLQSNGIPLKYNYIKDKELQSEIFTGIALDDNNREATNSTGAVTSTDPGSSVPLYVRYCLRFGPVGAACTDHQFFFERNNGQLFIVYSRWENSSYTGESYKMPVTVAGDNLLYRESTSHQNRKITLDSTGVPVSYDYGSPYQNFSVVAAGPQSRESAQK